MPVICNDTSKYFIMVQDVAIEVLSELHGMSADYLRSVLMQPSSAVDLLRYRYALLVETGVMAARELQHKKCIPELTSD